MTARGGSLSRVDLGCHGLTVFGQPCPGVGHLGRHGFHRRTVGLEARPPLADMGFIGVPGGAGYNSGMNKSSVFHSDAEILGGAVVFKGTRVPLQNLIDYIEGGYSLEEFLDDFPSVTRQQAIEGLEEARALLTEAAA